MSLPKILIVDDEENILRSLQRLLRKAFNVTTTTSPREALDLLQQHTFAILLSDQHMPAMDGAELMEQARLAAPHTMRIMLTGRADMEGVMNAINRGAVYRFLTKPWNDGELLDALHHAAQHFALEQENKRLQALTEAQNAKLEEFNQTLTQKVFVRTRQVTELNRALTNSFKGSIRVLAKLAEMQSPVLGNHAQRVAALCKYVGERLSLDEKALFQLEVAATLHDIGKIGMDPKMLAKPESRLSSPERAVLATHAAKGASLVQMMPNCEQAAAFIRHHHECFDGTGYPDGLQGDAIPLGARIIATVNAYDKALNMRDTFDRTTPEKALQHIREHSLRTFDPEIVDTLAYCLLTEKCDLHQEEEVQVSLNDLRPGLMLSRDLLTLRGILLLPKDSVIEQHHIPRLLRHQEIDPIAEGIYVHRKTPEPAL